MVKYRPTRGRCLPTDASLERQNLTSGSLRKVADRLVAGQSQGGFRPSPRLRSIAGLRGAPVAVVGALPVLISKCPETLMT